MLYAALRSAGVWLDVTSMLLEPTNNCTQIFHIILSDNYISKTF